MTVWPRRQRRNCWLLLALAGLVLVSPLESGLLPGRLGEVLEPSPAEAQTPPPSSFADGDPDPCPAVTGWSPSTLGWSPASTADDDWETASECVLRVPACPVSEVNPPFLMTLSVPSQDTLDELGDLAFAVPLEIYGGTGRYPELCENVVQKLPDETLYNRCRDLRGYVVIAPITHGGEEYCRALTPIACPTLEVTRSDGTTFTIATNRTGSQICGAVLRRGWTCPAGYERANTFNACYQHGPWSPGSHPACGPGAPEFPLGGPTACEDYVGDDFLRDPTERPCQGFIVGFDPGGNDYWCRYDPWLMRAECLRPVGRPADCSGPQASCIKRVSRTGGCDKIGQTILCRDAQDGFARNPAATLEDFQHRANEIRQVEAVLKVPHAVCNPCQHLPFSADPSDPRCASSATSRPQSRLGALERVLAVKRDYPAQYYISESTNCLRVTTTAEYESNTACQSRPVCADPPTGRITWTSEHPSGLAIVNNTVTVSVVDVPFERRTERTIGDISAGGVRVDRFPGLVSFAGVDTSDTTALTRATTIDFGDDNRRFDSRSLFVSPGTECRVRELPYIDLIAEELWPDHAESHTEILALFGASTLRSWDALDEPDRRALTEARGLEWLGDSPTDSQLAARRAALTVQSECVGNNPWECEWTPSRAGYFKLTAAGAWRMSQSRIRSWRSAYQLGSTINEALESDAIEQETERRLGELGLTADDVGLETDASDRLVGVRGIDPRCGEDRDFAGTLAYCRPLGDQFDLFNEDNAATASCSPLDLRVLCSSGENYNYTETEAVGVMVHEVRVNTVMPSR